METVVYLAAISGIHGVNSSLWLPINQSTSGNTLSSDGWIGSSLRKQWVWLTVHSLTALLVIILKRENIYLYSVKLKKRRPTQTVKAFCLNW